MTNHIDKSFFPNHPVQQLRKPSYDLKLNAEKEAFERELFKSIFPENDIKFITLDNGDEIISIIDKGEEK